MWRRWLGVAVALLAAVVALLVALWIDARPELTVLGGPDVSSVEGQVPSSADQSWVHGSYPICLDEPGEVEIASVAFESGDLEVTGWAVRPAPRRDATGTAYFTGDVRGTLASRGIEDVGVLTAVCDGGPRSFYELVLEVRVGAVSAAGDVVVVDYTSGGRTGTLTLPERVVYCVRPERPRCL